MKWISKPTGDMTLSVVDENEFQILKVDMLKAGIKEEKLVIDDRDTGWYIRTLIIDASFHDISNEPHTDAVGHVLNAGDTIACTLPSDRLGHTIRGFEKGGIVTRFTDHYVFYTSEDGTSRRKGYSGVVVVHS